MSRYLIVDIGAGTMDVLYYDEATDLHYKSVVKSPVQTVARKAAGIPGNLVVLGNEMGGGPVSDVLIERAKTAEVVMSESSAATLHHSRDRVRSWGIKIVDHATARDLCRDKNYSLLTLGDLEPDRLRQIVQGFGVPFEFEVMGVCAQDHGVPPEGVSHLDYRHSIFKQRLDQTPFPHALVYGKDHVPATFNRLTSIARDAEKFPANDIYVMDSGMAAILGASLDTLAMQKERIIILDVATSHTVAAALEHGKIAGFFEYHTRDINLERLEALLPALTNGKLSHKQILQEGGHGAYIRHAFGFEAVQIIVATGPKRRLVEKSKLPIHFGAPFGDNMMTGTVGVLEAIRRQQGRPAMSYV